LTPLIATSKSLSTYALLFLSIKITFQLFAIVMSLWHTCLFSFTIHPNLDTSLSRILDLRYKSDQSRQRFVMHLSSELQIASILAVLCHALQLAFQIIPISTALCHAP